MLVCPGGRSPHRDRGGAAARVFLSFNGGGYQTASFSNTTRRRLDWGKLSGVQGLSYPHLLENYSTAHVRQTAAGSFWTDRLGYGSGQMPMREFVSWPQHFPLD